MKRVIAFCNRKGGTGKTTTAVNVSTALAHMGRKVMLIDLDPQSHVGLSFGVSPKSVSDDISGWLLKRSSITDLLVDTYLENLKIVPATGNLWKFEQSFKMKDGARDLLSRRVEELNGSFDYVVFDTPPTVGLLTVSALVACKEVYVPMQTHFLSMEGLAETLSLLSKVRQRCNPSLALRGIILTFYRENTLLSRTVVDELKKNLGSRVLLHPVRTNVALAEAPGHGHTIFQHDLTSNGANDYSAIAKQIEGLL